MALISVVIITKNEAHIIGKTLESIKGLTDDTVIVDSGSSDSTIDIARSYNATVIETKWAGFGKTKNIGINAAQYDWILSIDADEVVDTTLVKAITDAAFNDINAVYNLQFYTYLGPRRIRFGEWGKDAHIRIFNRKAVRWDDAKVHEKLIIPANAVVNKLPGHILHYTMKDLADYATKMNGYALLNAENYYQRGKKATWIKRNLAHHFSFVSNYIFKLGLLDGVHGYWVARMTAHYTFLKYARLYELQHLT